MDQKVIFIFLILNIASGQGFFFLKLNPDVYNTAKQEFWRAVRGENPGQYQYHKDVPSIQLNIKLDSKPYPTEHKNIVIHITVTNQTDSTVTTTTTAKSETTESTTTPDYNWSTESGSITDSSYTKSETGYSTDVHETTTSSNSGYLPPTEYLPLLRVLAPPEDRRNS